jgi:hypothetical protein
MHDDQRPRPREYRNAACGLLEAFAAVYGAPLQARRAFAAALARGRVSALRALRTDPERFGALLPDADARARDFADEAAESFALCREHCTRPLVREAACMLRSVHAARRREQRLKAAENRVARIESEIDDTKKVKQWAEEAHAKLVRRAPRVYAQPQRAVDAVLRFGKAHGSTELYRVMGYRWKPAGRLRRRYRKDWLGWLGFTETKDAEDEWLWFRTEATRLIDLRARIPTPEWLAYAEGELAAARAAVEAIEAEPVPVHDPERTLRQAAQLLHDAMRLLERRPADAVPHLTRQLAPMLPDDAEMLVAQALGAAARYNAGSSGAKHGRERGPHRYDR